jgi:hypothetical protein
MIIDVHEPVAATQHAAKHARRLALDTVDAARGVDLHGPAQAAKAAAKGTAKRAAKKAAKRASVVAGRKAKRQAKRSAGKLLRRVTVVALLAGAGVAVAVLVKRRMAEQAAPWPADAQPAPYRATDGDAVGEDGARAVTVD